MDWRLVRLRTRGLILVAALAVPLLVVAPGATQSAIAASYGKPEWLPLRTGVGGGELRVGCTYQSPYAPENICDDPSTGAPYYHPYWALDLAVNQGGTQVYAAGAGVASINPLPSSYGYGTHIIIDHGSFGRTLYAHLASVSVTNGAQVDQNTVIGVVGNSGSTGGTYHLHFEYNDTSGGWGRSGSPNDPGELKACHGSTLVSYPANGGYSSWQGIHWGRLWVHSDGTACANPPPPPPTGNGGSEIKGVASGRCLDVSGAGTADGAGAQLYDCNGYPQQQWANVGGQLKVYGNYDKCLDADSNAGGADGTRIQIWACTGASNQQWIATSDGSFKSVAYGKCLDAVGDGTTNGTTLQLWDCSGVSWQRWTGLPTPNGGGRVQGLGSGRCLDVDNASISPGGSLQFWDCSGAAWQQWKRVGTQLQVYTDKCLDVVGGGTGNETAVQIWYCNGNAQQQWAWKPDGSVVSLESGRCLDAVGAGTANGTTLQIYDCLGSPNQKFFRSTETVPSASLTSLQPYPSRAAVRLKWSGSDPGSGIDSFDLRARHRNHNRDYTSWRPLVAWQATTKRAATVKVSRQTRTCFEVRAVDHAGNKSAWSTARCAYIA
jgi:hypothetical protein